MKISFIQYGLISLIFFTVKNTAQITIHAYNKQGTYFSSKEPITLDAVNHDQFIKANYTAKDVDEMNRQLKMLENICKQTPVLTNIKGFDAVINYRPLNYSSVFSYGLPCELKINFSIWLNSNNKFWHPDELASLDIFNVDVNYYYYQLYGGGFGNWAKMFLQPGKKTSIAHGIDLYGSSTIILYNPNRPAYWSNVTLKEYIKVFNDDWEQKNLKNNSSINVDSIIKKSLTPDQLKLMGDKELQAFKNSLQKQAAQASTINNQLNQQLKSEESKYSEEQLNQFAYLDTAGRNVLLKVDILPNASPLMKPNPDYWDRSQPRSAIQFMTFYVSKLVSPEDLAKAIKRTTYDFTTDFDFRWRMGNELYMHLQELENIILNNPKNKPQ